jgi:hypothetical protein
MLQSLKESVTNTGIDISFTERKIIEKIRKFYAKPILTKKPSSAAKAAYYLNKYLLQLTIDYFINQGCPVMDNKLVVNFPNTNSQLLLDLVAPISFDLDIQNKIQRKIKNIKKFIAQTEGESDFNAFVKTNINLIKFYEILKLKESGSINQETLDFVSSNLTFLFKEPESQINDSQYLFKAEQLMKRSEEDHNYKIKKVKSYKDTLKLFTNDEKMFFRKKVKETHAVQPTMGKIEGTQIEAIMHESLLSISNDLVVFWNQGSHRQGFDLETVHRDLESSLISSKTGNMSEEKSGRVVFLSSNRSQKQLTLLDKLNHIDHHWKEVSIITALVCVFENGKKKYLRLALDPKKILFNGEKNWKTANPDHKDKEKGWKFYSFDNGQFKAKITYSKSHQFDYFIPLAMFDIIDEFFI